MGVKLTALFIILILLIAADLYIFRKRIRNYHPLTWSLVELFWYLISFIAVCIGLVEIDRIEKVSAFRSNERALQLDYVNKKNNLYAQTILLKQDRKMPSTKVEGIRWFHKMKSLLDEGLETNRWEGFLRYSSCYIFKEPGCYTDVAANASEYGWPKDMKLNAEHIFLKDEIRLVVDSLSSLKKRKYKLRENPPDETANYQLRYFLIGLYLLGLSLKIVKIYADYMKAKGGSTPKSF